MKVTSSDGTAIAFDRIGSGPAVVLVDAANCYRANGPMGALAEALASDFTVYTYDRRGRGESADTLPFAVEREVDDLGAIIEAAGEPAFVHGFSSGAVLALHAARTLPIRKLTLLEPPLEGKPDESDLADELAELIAAGRRGDAFEHFNRSIGVPEEYLVGMRESPHWPAFEALAHTLIYDIAIVDAMSYEQLAEINTPALVLDSTGSDEQLRGWAVGVANALPNGEHRTLPGEWHGVAAEELAATMREFFRG